MNYKGTAVLMTVGVSFAKATLKEPAKLAIPQTLVYSFENRSELPESLDEPYTVLIKQNGYMYNIQKPAGSGWKTEAFFIDLS